MWKRISDSQYFLLFIHDLGYEIYVTDYFSIWNTVYSEKAFLAQLQQSNVGVELPSDNEFIKKGIQLLSNPENLKLKKLSFGNEENGKSLNITLTISFGFLFHLECVLSKGLDELYFQKITQPLLKTVSDLRASQSELRHLLIKKDNEIEEYKCEGGEIVLRHLKTMAFNDEEHMKKHNVYQENFGAHDIPTSLIEKVVHIPQQNILKQETEDTGPQTNVKMESELNIKMEPEQNVKTELKTELSEESSAPVILTPVSCKQEVIKRENKPTHRAGISKKRSKFNF